MLVLTPGVADLSEPVGDSMGIQLHKGQPVRYALFNIVIGDTRLCEETDHRVLIVSSYDLKAHCVKFG